MITNGTRTINTLNNLLATVAAKSERPLLDAEADLLQTTHLLHSAIENLSASFENIHCILNQHQSTMAQKIAEGVTGEDALLLFMSAKKLIDAEIMRVVAGLQFQDMTNQLLMHTITHLHELKSLMEMLAVNSESLSVDTSDEEIHQFFTEKHADISARTPRVVKKAVKQRDMLPGDVELF